MKQLGSFKQRIAPLLPYAIIVTFMLVVSAASVSAGQWFYDQEQQVKVEKPQEKASENTEAKAKESTPESIDDSAESTDTTINSVLSSGSNTSSGSNQSGSASVPTGQPVADTKEQTVTASLSVNGVTKGSVELASGSNQCSVLTQGLSAGLISDLDMRYSSQYGTQAVYVIDGVGDSKNIWWTFTVNGKSPPYGCSKISVNNGDSVNWKYVK